MNNDTTLDQIQDIISEVENTSGFIAPLISVYRDAEPDNHYQGMDIFYDIPGLDSVSYESQGPLVRLFCATRNALYVSADSDAHRAGAYYDAIEQAKSGGYKAVFYEHLS